MPPRNARSSGSKRYYDWKGERFWSVTTILSGGVPKPALLPWGIKSVAEGAVAAVKSGALVPMVEQDEGSAIQFLKGLPYSKRDKAANLGTEIHQAIEIIAQGLPWPDWPLPIRPHMERFRQFVETYKPEWIASEASVYSRTQSYAGTLDGIIRLRGEFEHPFDGRLTNPVLLIDAKTSTEPNKGPYPEVGLQLSMYRNAEFMGLPDGNEDPMIPVDGAAVLCIDPEGYRFLGVRTDDVVFTSALYAREVFRWQEETSKTVIGGPVSRTIDEVAA